MSVMFSTSARKRFCSRNAVSCVSWVPSSQEMLIADLLKGAPPRGRHCGKCKRCGTRAQQVREHFGFQRHLGRRWRRRKTVMRVSERLVAHQIRAADGMWLAVDESDLSEIGTEYLVDD